MTTLDHLRQLLGHGPTPPLVIVQPPGPYGDDQPYEIHSMGGVGYTVATGLCIEDARLIAAAPTHLADLITALEQIERIREVHTPVWTASPFPGGYICAACLEPVESEPCKTIRTLTELQEYQP